MFLTYYDKCIYLSSERINFNGKQMFEDSRGQKIKLWQ
jgi:hypothetical protein